MPRPTTQKYILSVHRYDSSCNGDSIMEKINKKLRYVSSHRVFVVVFLIVTVSVLCRRYQLEDSVVIQLQEIHYALETDCSYCRSEIAVDKPTIVKCLFCLLHSCPRPSEDLNLVGEDCCILYCTSEATLPSRLLQLSRYVWCVCVRDDFAIFLPTTFK